MREWTRSLADRRDKMSTAEVHYIAFVGTVAIDADAHKCTINGVDKTEYVLAYINQGEGSATVRDIANAFGGAGRVGDMLDLQGWRAAIDA